VSDQASVAAHRQQMIEDLSWPTHHWQKGEQPRKRGGAELRIRPGKPGWQAPPQSISFLGQRYV